MALTFKKRDDFDKVLGDLATLPSLFDSFDAETNEKLSDKKVKSPEDFLKNLDKNPTEKAKTVDD
jgi:hypothetical protein